MVGIFTGADRESAPGPWGPGAQGGAGGGLRHGERTGERTGRARPRGAAGVAREGGGQEERNGESARDAS